MAYEEQATAKTQTDLLETIPRMTQGNVDKLEHIRCATATFKTRAVTPI
jgi:hypothetical protein